MKLVYYPRENGACPLCIKAEDCIIHKLMSESLEKVPAHGDDDFEMVIYRCPNFHAKEEQ